MRSRGLQWLAASVLAVVACNPNAPGPQLGLGKVSDAERRELYVRLCAACHGAQGRGDGPCAEEFKNRPADLTRLAAQDGGKFPRQKVEAVLNGERPVRAHGTIEMPIWGQRLTPAHSGAAAAGELEQARLVTALTDYVESLQR